MSKLRGLARQEFPLKVKKLAFTRCCKEGIPYCEGCDIQIRGTLIYEHVTPDGLGGEPTLENCKIHCKNCADVKTFTEDNPRMAKADRVLKKNFGLTPKRVQIKSAGFQKPAPQKSASRPIIRRSESL
jgi:hypothetical protein